MPHGLRRQQPELFPIRQDLRYSMDVDHGGSAYNIATPFILCTVAFRF